MQNDATTQISITFHQSKTTSLYKHCDVRVVATAVSRTEKSSLKRLGESYAS